MSIFDNICETVEVSIGPKMFKIEVSEKEGKFFELGKMEMESKCSVEREDEEELEEEDW